MIATRASTLSRGALLGKWVDVINLVVSCRVIGLLQVNRQFNRHEREAVHDQFNLPGGIWGELMSGVTEGT